MPKKQAFLAIDLGAESGRAMLGVLDNETIALHELHRFTNQPVRLPSGLHWDFARLQTEVFEGIRVAGVFAREHDLALRSIGVDTWGVDYGLLDAAGELLEPPHCYRDERNQAAFVDTMSTIGAESLYERTGIQFMALNTLFQLVAAQKADSDLLKRADCLLFMPDLFHYFLSGKKRSETSIASTSQMLNPRSGEWDAELLRELGLPTRLLASLIPAGTDLGCIRPELAGDLGVETDVHIVSPAAHDTASAVAAIPAQAGSDWCFLSSGTWSLLGAELHLPCLTEAARNAPFTNEKGVAGTTRFLKNITGLYLLQECGRDFEARGQKFEVGDLVRQAERVEPFRTLVDPDYPAFAEPGDMLAKISRFAEKTRQPIPQDPGSFVRCCLESLAFCYRRTLNQLEDTLQRRFEVIHLVGGGARNGLLNQMTADACDRRIEVGPFEATSTGNVLLQALGLGLIANPAHIRTIVRNSVDLQMYEPGSVECWSENDGRFENLRTAFGLD